MDSTSSSALLVSTSWHTASDDLTSQPTRTLVKDFCENTLKSDEVSKFYCTVLDVEVSEDQKKDAESVGVTLIPATRSKWLDPQEDPPGIPWLVHHDKYYPQLKDMQNIKHVVSFSLKTQKAAAAIHTSLFYEAKLHQLSPSEPNGVLFTFDVWSKDACGLAGCHRSIIHDFCVRKGRTGELLKAYSTVLDVKLTEDQKKDAEKCGVTLIPAQKKKRANKKKDLPKLEWLMEHQSRFPDLRKLENVKYVVGYAPKTGWAAADIKETLFPDAKLVLINHVFPEKNRLLENGDEEDSELEEEMLNMASVADVLFSIGPTIYEYFQNAYRAIIDGRQLSDIPHEEILPKPGQVYFDSQPVIVKEMRARSILTYGQLDSLEAVERCFSMAYAVRTVANNCDELEKKLPEWKLCGVSSKMSKQAQKILSEKMESSKVLPKLYPASSAPTLLRSIQQSHLCLPPSCYTDYSFEGLEAMAAGLPTTVQDDSHIAAMIEKHFEEHKDYCVVKNASTNLAAKITKNLIQNIEAFQKAEKLKEDFAKSEAVTKSLAKFASIFIAKGADTQDSDEQVTEVNSTMGEVVSGRGTIIQSDITTTESIQTTVATVKGPNILEADTKRTDSRTMSSWKPLSEDKECEETITTRQAEMPIKENIEIPGSTTLKVEISATKDRETRKTTAVHPVMSNTEDVGTIMETADVQSSWKSKTEDEGTTENTAVQSRMSVTEDKETKENKAVHHVSMSVTEDMETTENKAVHHGMSVTADEKITGTTAVHPGISVTEDKETTEATAVYHGKVGHKKSKTSRNIKQTETLENKETSIQTKHRSQRKRKPIHESDKTINPKMARGEEIRSGQCKQSKHEQTEINENGHIKTKQTKQQTQRTEKISTSASKQPPLDSTMAKHNTDSNAVTVHVGLTEESYQQQMRDLDSQVQTISVREKKEQLKAAWEKIQAEMDKTECEAITSNNSLQRVDQNCRDNFGEVSVTSMKQDSLAISLDLPTLYNLYRLKQTCLSGSFPDSFEPLLITDKMREEADKVGLQLKLKAIYDQARFDELELFFINRDGGGLEPVKLYDDFNVAKDAEEITDDDTIADQKSHTMVTERVDSSSENEQGKSLEDIQSKLEMKRATLESQLKEAKEEKTTVEERCKELTQKLESSEQSLVSQRIWNSVERQKLQSELEKKEKQKKELQDTVDELELKLEPTSLKKAGEKGDWSLKLINGQHQDQGQKFKSPRGLAFHRDELVVCDSGNNIVQILNKDYICDKVLGSFDGQFAKPFRPKNVAISHFNHYFILDDENKQIVVCDENGGIIQIITLPENTKEVWDIALMDDFVLVTLRLISPDIHVRHERDDRLVKYTPNGLFVAEVGGQSGGQTQFKWPMSVAVNSKNVIMVYDNGNRCIKCFDSELNFLHQYGQIRLPGEIEGYISVDEDDNIYVCDVRDRIRKYQCDGNLICDLLKDDVIQPMWIAVMGNTICVVERNRDQIKVFSQ